jgi:N-acetyl-gamma-glutamyl-phosphate reductase
LLAQEAQIKLLQIDPAERKNPDAKKALMAEADLVVLCLHDDAARESVRMIENLPATQQARILDASSAHRTAPGWIFGFAEIEPSRAAAIRSARRVSNPGCHASGAIALLAPLTKSGMLDADFPLSIYSVSGYSGGGKSMIEAYEQSRAPLFELYGLALKHKHVPEIMMHAGLHRAPIFVPSVGNFRQGMLVSIPLHLDELPSKPSLSDIENVYKKHYDKALFEQQGIECAIEVAAPTEDFRIDALSANHSNRMEIRVFGNESNRQAVLVARFDNLGKGASRAAVQNIRIMLGH